MVDQKQSMNLKSGYNLEKRPSVSQTQSRIDFFNLLKKKTSTSTCTTLPEAESNPSSPQAIENGNEELQRLSDEKEAAFLRSVGWEENAVEDEALTEEEINTFLQELPTFNSSNLSFF
ncbi:hypothetical protein M5689_005643 [Euphorbia peplus]|nr:hypothetical protein M5689_005643 [Euphorbia peplus]